MDFRIGRTVVSPSSSASSGLLYPPAAPHSLTPTPIFYYPGLPLKIPPSPHSSPLVAGLNGNHHRTAGGTTSSSMMRSTATVQPSALHPPVPQSSPHHHRTAPGSSAGALDTCVFSVVQRKRKRETHGGMIVFSCFVALNPWEFLVRHRELIQCGIYGAVQLIQTHANAVSLSLFLSLWVFFFLLL
ncbi:hypothetical protein DAPPUDRAFT_306904 [Daphnia pulex]|uniref:Uncharacterized protein n=1 Tax=Daphnia pulex TaxID=6669 RepID=E9GZQ8_DAPPU|nr:hypothetical protein DAPPUDRAFT_306904 [Daphnia pulex]|eukprot:EFX75036.1 hypothetical protein DAPPUDRAFT_306904 [Daphnia pulex]